MCVSLFIQFCILIFFGCREHKEAKIMDLQSMNVKALRRSPRLTSAPPGIRGSSSETMLKSSKNFSSSKTRSSGKLIDKLLCLSWPEGENKRSLPSKPKISNFSTEMRRRKSPRFVAETENCGGSESSRKFEVHNSSLPIETQLRRSLKISQATKNGCSNVSVRRIDTHEIGFSVEEMLEMSPSFLQATENGDGAVSFEEHTSEVCNEQQLKIPFSHPMSLAGIGSAEVNSSSVRLSKSGDERPSKKFKISSADSITRMSGENFSNKIEDSPLSKEKQSKHKSDCSPLSRKKQSKHKSDPIFIGNPIPDDEAQERWRWRYEMKVTE